MVVKKSSGLLLSLFFTCFTIILSASTLAAVNPSGDTDPLPESPWWTTGGSLTTDVSIGIHDEGVLYIDAGASVRSKNTFLGCNANSTGTATLNGAYWTSLVSIWIGYYGNATFDVTSGGGIWNKGKSYIGCNALSTGKVTVEGPNSYWYSAHGIDVGRSGSGLLNIQNAGKVSCSDGPASSVFYDCFIGYEAGSTGTVNVDGTGSIFIADSIFVGGTEVGGGSGELSVKNGGSVVANEMTIIGLPGDSTRRIHFENSGTLTTGSLIASPAQITGTGIINANGLVSDVNMLFDAASGQSQTITLNDLPGQNITINLTTLNDSQHLGVGYAANGNLTIREGIKIKNRFGYLGYNPGSTGKAVVDGNNSTWNLHDYLDVGIYGNGELNIINGGCVLGGYCSIGYYSGSTGMVTVSGSGSTLSDTSNLSIGCEGKGTMLITDEGLVKVGKTLFIDSSDSGDSFINMSTGGKLALAGEADDSLQEFLDLVTGSDAIRYWDNIHDDWSDITEGTYGLDYTLQYIDDGGSDLFGYTLLTVLTAPKPMGGDADRDNDVDADDAARLAENWLTMSGAKWADGDFNNDGRVDEIDASILAANWQRSSDANPAVPEPSALALLLTAAAATFFSRCRQASRR